MVVGLGTWHSGVTVPASGQLTQQNSEQWDVNQSNLKETLSV